MNNDIFKCEICGKEFNSKLALGGHKGSHSRHKGYLIKKNFEINCKYCNMIFIVQGHQFSKITKCFCSRKCQSLYYAKLHKSIEMQEIYDKFLKLNNDNQYSKKDMAIELNISLNKLSQFIKFYDIDYDWKYKSNSRKQPKGLESNNYKPAAEYLVKNKSVSTIKLKSKLFLENYKEQKCEKCLNDSWNNLPIPLELHHIDGDSTNNELSNLQILCPNCHAQTDNYKNKNKKSTRKR